MNTLVRFVQYVDVSVHGFLNGFVGNPYLDRLAAFEENANLLKGGLFLALYVYLWFREGPKQEEQQRTIISILMGTLLVLVVCRTVADLGPFRVRPMFDPSLAHHAYSIQISRNMESWSSFPSDTAAYFCSLAIGLVHLMGRRYAVSIFSYTALWICLPRMYLATHYFSDIVAGAAIALVLIAAAVRWDWFRSMSDIALQLKRAKPQLFYSAAFVILFEMGVLFNDVRYAARGMLEVIQLSRAHGPVGIWAWFGVLAALLTVAAARLLPAWRLILIRKQRTGAAVHLPSDRANSGENLGPGQGV
jgi:undecaprenyl-diphosphatase